MGAYSLFKLIKDVEDLASSSGLFSCGCGFAECHCFRGNQSLGLRTDIGECGRGERVNAEGAKPEARGANDYCFIFSRAFVRDALGDFSFRRAVCFGVDRPQADHVLALVRICSCHRISLARLLGRKCFWDRDFLITKDTLEPRPETEGLVEKAAKFLREKNSKIYKNQTRSENNYLEQCITCRHDVSKPVSQNQQKTAQKANPNITSSVIRVADCGTGCGCILISLLSEIPNANGIGIDISSGAISTAVKNASDAGVSDRAEFVFGSWENSLVGEFDCIVSNPPYIKRNSISGLDDNVRLWDPSIALDGGDDGLESYRRLIPVIARHLKNEGAAFLEIAHDQADHVFSIASKFFENICIDKDVFGNDRYLSLYREK